MRAWALPPGWQLLPVVITAPDPLGRERGTILPRTQGIRLCAPADAVRRMSKAQGER